MKKVEISGSNPQIILLTGLSVVFYKKTDKTINFSVSETMRMEKEEAELFLGGFPNYRLIGALSDCLTDEVMAEKCVQDKRNYLGGQDKDSFADSLRSRLEYMGVLLDESFLEADLYYNPETTLVLVGIPLVEAKVVPTIPNQ